jgi:hypothetical protein
MTDGVGQGGLAGMSKWGMTNVVTEPNRLDQIFVEAQPPRNGARDLGHLEGVRQAGAVMVTLGGNKYLSFVFEASEWLGMQYAVAVTLEAGPHWRFRFGVIAGGGIAFGGIG